MSAMDPVLLAILVLIVAVTAWNFTQVQSLNRRLSTLEKQYLAVVKDLEERIYPG